MGGRRNSVDLVKQIYERFNARDVAGLFELLSADFAYHARAELPGSGTYDRAGSRERLTALFEIFSEARFDPEEFIDAGEQVIVCGRETATGQASGAAVQEEIAHLWRLAGGRVHELRVYSKCADAVRAAGLDESVL
jgi:ketosteroid isomerase-like protein